MLDGKRFMYWNFISGTQEAMEDAKQHWQADEFPRVSTESSRIALPSATRLHPATVIEELSCHLPQPAQISVPTHLTMS